ncbi:BTAD domain-containing putative transcriptional regulator [Spongisporangium articulatum]|uniref:BTAD domain-containing putative transcriptional regulator n=1 Tax=Spongisporangium articulatum TaxID=3362603 RepID=A0ABW8ANV5_9ACTN
MLTIRLLGRPSAVRHEPDGTEVPLRPPRGRKAWALLGYLVLAERPPSRRQVADLLFADADDPLGALRWSLAELRRALGLPESFTGDPIEVALPPGVRLDLHEEVTEGTQGAERVPISTGELLEGVSLPTALEFESWLVVARHRVSASVEARWHEAAVAHLAGGRPREAVRLAAAAVARNPLEEGNHELLVRSLATAGDREAALRQVAVCEDLFGRELGVEPSPALRDAAGAAPGSPSLPAAGGRAAALNQLEAGRAAIVAGAVDAGVQCLRRAVADSEQCGDDALHARALVALGGALVHSVRGRDEEGAVVLHAGLELATSTGDAATAVTACRELGFIDVQAGRRETGDGWLARAQAAAESAAELGAILGVRGMNASDRGDYATAFEQLTASVEAARSAGDARQAAWSQSLVARAHLLRGELSQARVEIAQTLDVVAQQRWMAFQPWPQALSAELSRLDGDLTGAADTLEQAWVMALQIADPCWEGMVARGLGLLHSARGATADGQEWLAEAGRRCTRTSDRYQWVTAYVLDATATAALGRGDADAARGAVRALSALAARTDMREMVVRAHLHRHRLGEPDALRAARAAAADVDNPQLVSRLR